MAYKQVCAKLRLREKNDDRITEAVGLRIIEAAQGGPRDPAKLRLQALLAPGMPDNQIY